MVGPAAAILASLKPPDSRLIQHGQRGGAAQKIFPARTNTKIVEDVSAFILVIGEPTSCVVCVA